MIAVSQSEIRFAIVQPNIQSGAGLGRACNECEVWKPIAIEISAGADALQGWSCLITLKRAVAVAEKHRVESRDVFFVVAIKVGNHDVG